MTAPTVPLPAFVQPAPPPVDPYNPQTDPANSPDNPANSPDNPANSPDNPATGRANLGRRRRLPFGPLNPKAATPDDTPTDTFSTGDDDRDRGRADLLSRDETTRLVIGLVGLVVAGAALLVQARDKRRKLRRPTRQQTRDIARPLGKLMLRLADSSVLNPVLVEVIETAAATGAYITDGPLTTLDGIDAGIPANLQEESE